MAAHSTRSKPQLPWVLAALLTVGLAPSHARTDPGTCSSTTQTSPFLPPSDTCPLLLHGTGAASSGGGSPWSYPPYCVPPENWPIGSPPLCVFAAAHFRGGAGLGLLATPELAASVVDRLDDAAVPARERDHPSSPLASEESEPAYAVEDVPGRGKGVVARRKIGKWETVLVDYPAVIVQNDYHLALSAEQGRKMLKTLVDRLPEGRRDEVLGLSWSGEGGMVEGILKANVFSADLTQKPFVLYPRGSEFIAMRDIEPGEEITQSYTSPGLKHADRQQALEDWGFTCTCPLCSGLEEDIDESDGRKDRLREIFATLQGENPDGDTTDQLVEEITRLIDAESMWPMLCPFYQVVSTAYMENWDFEQAEKYVKLAEEMCGRIGGDDDQGGEQRIRRLWTMLEKRRQEGL